MKIFICSSYSNAWHRLKIFAKRWEKLLKLTISSCSSFDSPSDTNRKLRSAYSCIQARGHTQNLAQGGGGKVVVPVSICYLQSILILILNLENCLFIYIYLNILHCLVWFDWTTYNTRSILYRHGLCVKKNYNSWKSINAYFIYIINNILPESFLRSIRLRYYIILHYCVWRKRYKFSSV